MGYSYDEGALNISKNQSHNMTLSFPPENDLDESIIMMYYYLWKVATPTVFGIITIIGIIGNCLVIHVITSRKSMRTVTNILLLNLAFADLSLIIVCVPPTAVKYVLDDWPFGEAFCKILNYIQYVCIYVNIYTLVVISLYRFLTVVCYSRFQSLRTSKKGAFMVIVTVWLTMLAVNIPILFIHKVKVTLGYVYCGMVKIEYGKQLHITFFVFAYILPLSFIMVLYLLILHFLRSTRTSTIDKNHSKERAAHARKIVTMVVVAFGVSWLPLHIHFMVSYFGKVPGAHVYEVFRIFWHCLMYGNSCVNPIIYNFVSTEFRKAFKETMCICRRKVSSSSTQSGNGPTELTHMVTVKEK